jgi:mRNA interferase MazF
VSHVVITRGDIWWADLPDPDGSAPGYRRPVLVVQSDAFNRSRLATVTVVSLTANLRLVDAPGNVLVAARPSDLPRDSVANVSQVLTIDRRRLTERVRRLPPRILDQVDDGLRLALAL